MGHQMSTEGKSLEQESIREEKCFLSSMGKLEFLMDSLSESVTKDLLRWNF